VLIAGFTRLWQDHPGAMQGALAQDDAILRTAIEDHGGYRASCPAIAASIASGAAANAAWSPSPVVFTT